MWFYHYISSASEARCLTPRLPVNKQLNVYKLIRSNYGTSIHTSKRVYTLLQLSALLSASVCFNLSYYIINESQISVFWHFAGNIKNFRTIRIKRTCFYRNCYLLYYIKHTKIVSLNISVPGKTAVSFLRWIFLEIYPKMALLINCYYWTQDFDYYFCFLYNWKWSGDRGR